MVELVVAVDFLSFERQLYSPGDIICTDRETADRFIKRGYAVEGVDEVPNGAEVITNIKQEEIDENEGDEELPALDATTTVKRRKKK